MIELRAGACSSLGLAKSSDEAGAYHYALSPLLGNPGIGSELLMRHGNHEYAVISSDDRIRLFEAAELVTNAGTAPTSLGRHETVTCIAPFPGRSGGGWMTGGRDGSVKHWDRRASGRPHPVQECSSRRKIPYLSIASDPNGHLWAVGTELTNHVAEVQIWDMRNLKEPAVTYVESHSDDVSVGTLLSGSTDGLVNIFATNFPSDEDDAVVQTINHGSSIHRAGFLPCHPFFSKNMDSAIYALSHDETFSVYKRENAAELADEDEQMDDGTDDAAAQNQSHEWGDLRPMLNCEYVIDVLPDDKGAIVAVGSHGEKRVDLFQLRYKPGHSLSKAWKLRDKPIYRLRGAHSEEIVRSVAMFREEENSTILTAGEDGLVRSWNATSSSSMQDTIMAEDMGTEHTGVVGSEKGGVDDKAKLKRKRDRDT